MAIKFEWIQACLGGRCGCKIPWACVEEEK